MRNQKYVLDNEMHKILWDFEIQTGHLISAKRPDFVITQRKKRKEKKKQWTCRLVDFVVPADHRVKLKESKKKDKYLDLGRELKKLWNMKVTTIPIVIIVTKGLVQGPEDLEIRGRVKTIQTTEILRSTRILDCPTLPLIRSL